MLQVYENFNVIEFTSLKPMHDIKNIGQTHKNLLYHNITTYDTTNIEGKAFKEQKQG